MDITVEYESIDHFHERRRFKTLGGAQRYAAKWVGEKPTLGSHYAVSDDGVGEITADCRLSLLFPKLEE